MGTRPVDPPDRHDHDPAAAGGRIVIMVG